MLQHYIRSSYRKKRLLGNYTLRKQEVLYKIRAGSAGGFLLFYDGTQCFFGIKCTTFTKIDGNGVLDWAGPGWGVGRIGGCLGNHSWGSKLGLKINALPKICSIQPIRRRRVWAADSAAGRTCCTFAKPAGNAPKTPCLDPTSFRETPTRIIIVGN